jgi:hypothetical protein
MGSTVTSTSYVTPELLAEHLRIDDQDDGPRLSAVSAGVSRAIDQWCGQFFYVTSGTAARVFTPCANGHVNTHPFATTTGLTVATGTDGTYDTTWTISTDFVVKPDNGRSSSGELVAYNRLVAVGSRSFPVSVRPTVQVTAQWGWPAVPDAVTEAALIKCARVFRRRDTPEGIAGGVEFGAIRISSREDPDVAMLLAPYRDTHGSPVVFG